ncbi:MAG: AbrB/MazE/SpoVT family DNA-binding domain-containing protein [Bifidobacteriaceae bacterium]|jgi:AbrB family looped-hinge helix DNA binding protein|nr:AbrB/MazE/SpoVT family DNA-binding domain-containing protein [Bifidobacteriaceae bacterium]
MAFTTVTSKGQVTIPVAIRQLEGISEGTKLEVFRLAGGGVGMVPRRRSLDDLYACLPRPAAAAGAAAEVELGAAVAEALASDDARIAGESAAGSPGRAA